MSSSQGTPSTPGNDPSMEDILASIRRILSEDETTPPATAAPAPQPGAFHPSSQPALNPTPPPAPANVLTLDTSMLVREPQPVQPISAHPPLSALGGAPLAALNAIVSPGMETQMPPLHVAAPAPVEPPPVFHAPEPMPTHAEQQPPTDSLVAPEAAAAASASVGELVRTLTAERQTAVYRGGPTLEDLVREEMRPLLKHWLDTHLPPMVERLVRVEIERVVNRAVS